MPSEHAGHWILDPAVDQLNHGSFGATPRVVLQAQRAWQERLEADPTRFVSVELEPALDAARAALAAFVRADPRDLVFVPNATTGANAVLRSLELHAGDELVTTDHAYNAVRNTMEYVAARSGARVLIAPVAFPGTSPDTMIDSVLARVGSRTRLVVIDHITSATALVAPLQRIVDELTARGVETLVDGAHAPGQVDLDLEALGATYYTGNLHKWVCAPKGSAFLWVRRDRQEGVHPVTISHGANSPRRDRSRMQLEFDWVGTADPSAWLTVPVALSFGAELVPDGWPGLRRRNHELCLVGRDLLCDALDVQPPAPDEMVGCMSAVPLPPEVDPVPVQGVSLYGDAVHDGLLERGLQVMVTPWPQRPEGGAWRRLIRISVAAYNDRAQLERLAEAARQVVGLAGERLEHT